MEQVHDRRGRVIRPGVRVRVLDDTAQEGEVRRVIPGYRGDRYALVAVIVDGAKAGKAERLVRAAEVEVVEEGVTRQP
ncbi:MAG: hypothetical protein QN122_01590 [Armatimonadota bacterium]|nr:hypothetical protein [Armatimonadota bacterium]MDR7448372.1 hypothetical protein [Armatimonadota bacterium]MDR7459773.1 hypothetical protein [Armatimonadota bacterium]MDR7479264.1 hypothetical protein [Armatimonadota bacterium]MDR7489041.1 hypothetical protein [Armatimonadota bacterium]